MRSVPVLARTSPAPGAVSVVAYRSFRVPEKPATGSPVSTVRRAGRVGRTAALSSATRVAGAIRSVVDRPLTSLRAIPAVGMPSSVTVSVTALAAPANEAGRPRRRATSRPRLSARSLSDSVSMRSTSTRTGGLSTAATRVAPASALPVPTAPTGIPAATSAPANAAVAATAGAGLRGPLAPGGGATRVEFQRGDRRDVAVGHVVVTPSRRPVGADEQRPVADHPGHRGNAGRPDLGDEIGEPGEGRVAAGLGRRGQRRVAAPHEPQRAAGRLAGGPRRSAVRRFVEHRRAQPGIRERDERRRGDRGLERRRRHGRCAGAVVQQHATGQPVDDQGGGPGEDGVAERPGKAGADRRGLGRGRGRVQTREDRGPRPGRPGDRRYGAIGGGTGGQGAGEKGADEGGERPCPSDRRG